VVDLTARWTHAGPRMLNRLPEGAISEPYRLFDLRPLGPVIGAEIAGVDLGIPLAPDVFADIDRALLEWKVLFFRDQGIGADEQRAFALNWGKLEEHPVVPHGETKDVVRIAINGKNGGWQNTWHSDGLWRAEPPLAFVLRMITIPPDGGGDTLWSDCAAAYDNLPPEVKARIAGLDGKYDFAELFGAELDPDELAAKRAQFPPVAHPVVTIHPRTGRKLLFANAGATSSLAGLEPAESEALLRMLFEQAHVPEFQVRWRWRPGDVAFWDNWATWHYAVSDYYPNERLAERVSIIRR
jgi:taurine dioxygenase